jgi:hypothetical protein
MYGVRFRARESERAASRFRTRESERAGGGDSGFSDSFSTKESEGAGDGAGGRLDEDGCVCAGLDVVT